MWVNDLALGLPFTRFCFEEKSLRGEVVEKTKVDKVYNLIRD